MAGLIHASRFKHSGIGSWSNVWWHRYETLIDGDQRKKDWSNAEKYYQQAVEVFPEGAASAKESSETTKMHACSWRVACYLTFHKVACASSTEYASTASGFSYSPFYGDSQCGSRRQFIQSAGSAGDLQ